MLSLELIAAIVDQHALKGQHSIHFLDHWARVLENGRRLTLQTNARLDVVELFSVFHDSARVNDGTDPAHGARGAKIAVAMRGRFFDIDQAGMDLLTHACAEHTFGKTEGDCTIRTCWDSDRLDLGRAGFYPIPARLCTDPGRDPEMIVWAHERSVRHYFPETIRAEWGISGER